ncbi:hypothetical protein GCM10009733_008490 [Nonomuraea maheshkhaliensis]|uniref:Uncharacterized protein n=1 Tax=Nonomuraea maheshkhaliensis TaxID=419590 RepID=A0ABN2EQE0_9ACTN
MRWPPPIGERHWPTRGSACVWPWASRKRTSTQPGVSNYSAESYESVRASWRNYARQHGFSRFYDGPAYEATLNNWRERRPGLVADDWIEEQWKRD